MIPYFYIIALVFVIGLLYELFSNPIREMSDSSVIPNTPKKIIVTYKGANYDITDFVVLHPGGKDVLVKNNGNDVEQLMLDNQHSENAHETLEKYKIV